MKLGFAEKILVNSPIRALSLRLLEPTLLESHVPFPRHADILDLGCGNGHGLIMLHYRCLPASLTGVDVDPAQLASARKRLIKTGIPAQLVEASAEKIPLSAHDFDCITSFGCLHHVENWRLALTECARLLRHGGLLYALEFYRPLTGNWLFSHLFHHPDDRFTHTEFQAELANQGFHVLYHSSILGLMGVTIARLTGNPQTYD
jgi:SAM-dependent methyltransferase